MSLPHLLLILVFIVLLAVAVVCGICPRIVITIHRKPSPKWRNEYDWIIWTGGLPPFRKFKITKHKRKRNGHNICQICRSKITGQKIIDHNVY